MTTPQPPRAFCCEPMRGYSTAKCQEHRDEPALCSDVLVAHSERHGPGLPIHVDGGGGMIVIEFCPWCGTRIGDGAGTATPAGPASLSDTQLTQLRRHVEEGYSVRPGDVSLTFADMLGEIEKLHARIAAVVVRCYEADRTTFTTSTHPGYVDTDEIRALLAGGEQS